jgi:hypothetical protein
MGCTSMQTLKKFLLAAAAGLASAQAAYAADAMPAGAAEPVSGIEYVQWCDTMGNGYYVIPGTDTCLRISGYVRADWNYREPRVSTDNEITTRGRGRLEADARTMTESGVLRSFIQAEFTKDTGTDASTAVTKAFITFAGFTAGATTSFFDFGPNDGILVFQRVSDRGTVNLLAYEAKIGNFKLGLSVEDPESRRVRVHFPTGTAVASERALDRGYAGVEIPDVVGRVLYEDAWGSAQLSAGVRQIEADPGMGSNYAEADQTFGWGVQFGTKILLPQMQAGNFLTLHAAYADGSLSYLGYDVNSNRVSAVTSSSLTGNLNAVNARLTIADAAVSSANELETTTGYTLAANFRHFWNPGVLRSNVAVSYTDVDQFNGSRASGSAGTSTPGALSDFTEVVASANLVWTPSNRLQLGPEVQYRQIDIENGVEDSEWAARFRIQRDF